MPNTVTRLDVGKLGKAKRTPTGGLRVPANLTRVGVLEYAYPDGRVVRELRHPDEVFNADSLATLAGAAVTDLHPSEMVTPGNWRSVSVGHVGEAVKADGNFVAAELSIEDARMIEAVERGDRAEISCGYSCVVEPQTGEWNGEKYDAVQRSIRYNHAALGPRNWGRAGADVALRLDSNGNACPLGTREEKRMTIRLDGIDYDVTTPQFAQAFERFVARADSEKAEREKELEKLRADAISLKAERDRLEGERDAAKAQPSPERMDALIKARVALVTDAARFLGEDVKLDGMSDAEIVASVVKKERPKLSIEGKSHEYVRAVFDSIVTADPYETSRRDEADFRKNTLESRREDSGPALEKAIAENNARMAGMAFAKAAS